MQKILEFKLRTLARWCLARRKPMIVAITGNAGKTSTKAAIGAVLGANGRVRVSTGNLNNEFGVPLTILGDFDAEYYEHGPSVGFWLKVLMRGFFNIFFGAYPATLVLEYGADHPGDIKKLAAHYRPHMGVVTTVGDVPVHIEFFKDAEAVAEEKSELITALGPRDSAILNHDDDRVLDMKQKSKAHVWTYGFDEGSTVRVSDFEYRSGEDGAPLGVVFKIHYAGSFVPIVVNGSLGRSQAWAAAAAAAAGLAAGLNLVQISHALDHHHGPKGRLKIIAGIRHAHIIDDTYNASPASTQLALETLRDLPGLRKVAILGDMLELGTHSEAAHQNIGILAARCVDLLICVGPRAREIARTAEKKMSLEMVLTFDTAAAAAAVIRDHIKQYDLVLIKGSQGIRMEKITAALMANPLMAKDLLVRQSAKWLKT